MTLITFIIMSLGKLFIKLIIILTFPHAYISRHVQAL